MRKIIFRSLKIVHLLQLHQRINLNSTLKPFYVEKCPQWNINHGFDNMYILFEDRTE